MKPNTCLVVDVWEGQLEIDEAVLKSNGVTGMGIRINDMNGGHHLDTNFLKQWEEAKNFVRFPYFVYNPWVDGPTNFAWLKQFAPVEAMTVAIDVEVRYSAVSPATYAGELVKFLELCKSRWKTIIYTAQWFLPYLASWPKVDYWWAQYPAGDTYFSGVKTWDDLKTALDKLDKPFNVGSVPGTLKMWQFSGDYLTLPGSTRKIDVNIFYGSPQELSDYIGTSATPDPDPDPVAKSGLYSITAAANYFARPGGGPLTLPMSRVRKLGDNLVRYLYTALVVVLKALNKTNSSAVDLITGPNWGPSKGRDEDYVKWIGLLWPGRNIVKIEEVIDGWGRVEGLSLLDAGAANAYDNPETVHMVYDFNKTAGYGERNKPVYVPILGGPWWVDMSKLVSIDAQLPKAVKIKAYPNLTVRAAAGTDGKAAGHVAYGASPIVSQVVIAKDGIWGKVSGGWIGLRHRGTNWTDWKI
jgi:GH25 family lysozyme M1 (1,4-beta-N-acetylmuramidase)